MRLTLQTALLVLSATPCSSLAPSDRRAFLLGGLTTTAAPLLVANAIDVTGLPVEGGASIKSQLQTYQSTTSGGSVAVKRGSSTIRPYDGLPPVATYAYSGSALGPRISKLGLGLMSRYEDQVLGPNGESIGISVEYPSDWLQLDKATGGIQFVDQRNGDKFYILRATLPEGETLESVPKKWFGTVLLDPRGTLVRSGNDVEDGRVSFSSLSSQVVPCRSSTACSIPRRRLKLKYATVTGNGLRVERRGLVDAYQVLDGEVYMVLTSTNAVKFEAEGRERETAEAIAESFRAFP